MLDNTQFNYLRQAVVDPRSVEPLRKLASGRLLSKIPKGLWGLGKLLVQGNELEGLEAGARIFGGYNAPFLPAVAGGLAFDAARPWLARKARNLDKRLLGRYGSAGTYGDVRKNLRGAQQKFTAVSKFAPAATFLGEVQQATTGFNQFDPANSIEAGKQNTLNSLAGSLGYDDIGSLRADLDQLRPVIGAATGVMRSGNSAINYLRSPAVRRRLSALDGSQMERYTGMALNNYGKSFLDRSPYDQAAMIDSIYRQSL